MNYSFSISIGPRAFKIAGVTVLIAAGYFGGQILASQLVQQSEPAPVSKASGKHVVSEAVDAQWGAPANNRQRERHFWEPAIIGDEVRSGDRAVTAEGMRLFIDDPAVNIVRVNMTMSNLSNQDNWFSDGEFVLEDAQGRQYSEINEVGILTRLDDVAVDLTQYESRQTAMFAGESRYGAAYFRVPKDALPGTVKLHWEGKTIVLQ